LPEWHSCQLPGLELTPSDRAFVQKLGDQQISLIEAREGLLVETRGFVGVVQLESVRICVQPRLVGGPANLVRLIDYTRRLNLMREVGADAGIDLASDELFDLLVLLLGRSCEGVLDAGVVADYLPQHDDLPVLRGRLDLKAQVLRRWGQVDRLVCDFDERLTDVPENRWLLRALRVAWRGVDDPALATTVRRLVSTWEEFCRDDPRAELARPVLTRINQHYARALDLAYLIVDGIGVHDVLRFGSRQSFAFLLSMPRLFEEFVTCMLNDALAGTGAIIAPQSSFASVLWDPEARQPFGYVRPDVTITFLRDGVRIPVDAKYKDYDHKKLGPADVYQAAIYGLTLARPPAWGHRICLLFHPSTSAGITAAPAMTQRVQIRGHGDLEAEVMAVGLPVDRFLDERKRGHRPTFQAVRTLVASVLEERSAFVA
jgi:5-methylcytosine-specific restriction enzyme subunit McrC